MGGGGRQPKKVWASSNIIFHVHTFFNSLDVNFLTFVDVDSGLIAVGSVRLRNIFNYINVDSGRSQLAR